MSPKIFIAVKINELQDFHDWKLMGWKIFMVVKIKELQDFHGNEN
jgi:hypothetical protein